MNSFGIDLGINIQKPNINMIEESHNKDQYYRIVYRVNGKSLGIYEAAKINMSYDEWKEFKTRKEVTWLPVPEGEYGDNNRSYFTKEGWVIFKKKTLPLLEKYLKGGNIETSVTDEIPGTIVYKDRYQVVVSTNTILEGVNNPDIEVLNKEMRSWDYGYICNGKRLTGNKIPEHFKGYKLMGPKVVEKEKIGTCWDYTAYEDYWFNEHNIPHQCWYFQCNRGDNHSWLSYKDGNKVIAFEASWKSYAGLRKYNSEEEMVKDYVGRSMSDWKGEASEEKPGNYFVVKFNQFDIDGMDPYDYMHKCAMYGTFFKGDKKVLQQWKDNREPLKEDVNMNSFGIDLGINTQKSNINEDEKKILIEAMTKSLENIEESGSKRIDPNYDPDFESKPVTRESVINKKSRIPKEIREEYADDLVALHKWARRSKK